MEKTSSNFDTLVISGGGIKGFAQLGVLHYLCERSLDINSIKTMAGTSVGSMLCFLLGCGYTPIELFRELYCKASLLSGNLKSYTQLVNFFQTFGFLDIECIISSVRELAIAKLGTDAITFKQLYESKGIALYITTTNVRKCKCEYYSVFTHPDTDIIETIKKSCNIPFIFTNQDFCIDGGSLDNFPLTSILPRVEKGTSKKILGILTSSVPSLPSSTLIKEQDINFMDYIYRIIMMPVKECTELKLQNILQKHPSLNIDIIDMTLYDVYPLDFSISSEKKMDIFIKGYKYAEFYGKRKFLYVSDKDGWDMW